MKSRSFILFGFASGITSLALAIAVASAWQRAGSDLDRWLLACVSVAIVLAVHWLPGLFRRSFWIIWPVWVICFLCAVWGHVWFFSQTGRDASEIRAASSAQMLAMREQRETLESALRFNKARSAATVASILARTTDPQLRSALEIELTESKRANEQRARLVALAAETTVTAMTDPVLSRVTAMTGISAEAFSLVMNVGLATLLEFLGMLLWREVLRGQDVSAHIPDMQVVSAPVIERLRMAVRNGECDTTVTGIRQFLACSQARAMQLRRELMQIETPA